MATKKGEFMKNDLFFRCWNERCRLMRGAAFTLAEVFSPHCADFRKSAFTLAEVFSLHCADFRKSAFTLAEVFSSHCADFRKSAFTLAEVLITLAIIGVVAAMTLPTLIQNHQKQAYVTGLKKAVSVSQNMLKKMQADEGASSIGTTQLFSEGICERVLISGDNGETVNGNGCEDFYGNPSVFEALVPKYLKVVKICKGEDCEQLYRYSSFNCLNNTCTLNLASSSNKPCSMTHTRGVCQALQGFYTEDGMIFYIYPQSPGFIGGRLQFLVDVNGEKGPNVLNRDLFEFGFDENGKLAEYPYQKEGVFIIMQNGWKMDY